MPDPPTPAPPLPPLRDRICLFTDHLDDSGFSYAEVARMLRELRIAGPDLTVRPGGLVDPQRAAEELPKAFAAFRAEGLTVPMITTGLTSARDPAARATLATAGQLGIRYYKLGYYPYQDPARWSERLAEVRGDLEGLLRLGEGAGIQAGFHNHAGATVGGALWDSWELLQPLDPRWVGFYFDPGIDADPFQVRDQSLVRRTFADQDEVDAHQRRCDQDCCEVSSSGSSSWAPGGAER